MLLLTMSKIKSINVKYLGTTLVAIMWLTEQRCSKGILSHHPQTVLLQYLVLKLVVI